MSKFCALLIVISVFRLHFVVSFCEDVNDKLESIEKQIAENDLQIEVLNSKIEDQIKLFNFDEEINIIKENFPPQVLSQSPVQKINKPIYHEEISPAAANLNTILIYRKIDKSNSFNSSWFSYENGFGNKDSNYFIGLKKLHELTRKPSSLQIKADYLNNFQLFAKYDRFKIADRKEEYKLISLGHYVGNDVDPMRVSENMDFKTYDHSEGYNWALVLGYGWWFDRRSQPW